MSICVQNTFWVTQLVLDSIAGHASTGEDKEEPGKEKGGQQLKQAAAMIIRPLIHLASSSSISLDYIAPSDCYRARAGDRGNCYYVLGRRELVDTHSLSFTHVL